MSTHRVIATAAPTAAQVEKVCALLAFAALAAAGRAATDRGSYVPAEVSASAEGVLERLRAVLVESAPTDERTARMVAAAVQTAGGRAIVVAA